MTCTGPNKEKLRTVTKECGCTIEWFIHSVWLKGLISLMVYALMNASRLGFVDGLSRVLWKSLHPGTFTVWATCDVDGKLLPSGTTSTKNMILSNEVESEFGTETTVTEEMSIAKSAYLSDEIRDQIQKSSMIFQMGGIGMMVVSLLLNVPWILVVRWSPDGTRPKWLY